MPTPDGTRLLSIGPNTLAITVLRPYDGWHNFKPRIERALQAFCEVTSSPSPVTRVGVRYINRVVVTGSDAKAITFLKGIPDGGEPLQAPVTSFMQRAEYVRPDGIKVLITQATLQPTTPDTSEFLLDIDVLRDNAMLSTQAEIIGVAETLHEIEGTTLSR